MELLRDDNAWLSGVELWGMWRSCGDVTPPPAVTVVDDHLYKHSRATTQCSPDFGPLD